MSGETRDPAAPSFPRARRPAEAADPAEAEGFLAAHPEISAVDLILVDLNGVCRGKILRRSELLSVYRGGRHLPGSILGLDLAGEDVEETGLVWSDGDADRIAWPVPGTLVTMPFTDPPRAQFQVMLYELDGAPMPADPRHALLGQQRLLAGDGRTPVLAFELEFYLFDRARTRGAPPLPAALPLTGERPELTRVYGLDELDRLQPFADALYRAGEAQGIPFGTLISEYAPGQYELTLGHKPDAARAADDLAMAKRLLRSLAARHGMVASFMAKPVADRAGSGMHLHASLAGADGANLFADVGDGLADMLRHAVAGLLATMPEAMLVFAPHLNSWRRFASGSYAPLSPVWGVNNRSVSVRVTAGDPKNRHLEHRPAGVDANPYLVAATVLAGMRLGIAAAAEPPAAITGNGYAGAASGPAPDWRSAILAAEASPFLREALGERALAVFTAIKRAEYARFAAIVTEEEYRLGLEGV